MVGERENFNTDLAASRDYSRLVKRFQSKASKRRRDELRRSDEELNLYTQGIELFFGTLQVLSKTNFYLYGQDSSEVADLLGNIGQFKLKILVEENYIRSADVAIVSLDDELYGIKFDILESRNGPPEVYLSYPVKKTLLSERNITEPLWASISKLRTAELLVKIADYYVEKAPTEYRNSRLTPE